MRVCKRLFVMAAILAVAAPASAQVTAGVKGGINFSNVKFDGEGADVNLDTRRGLIGGVFAVWPVSPAIGIQTEALYSQNGATLDDDDVNGSLELDYLDFPVLARFSSPASTNAAFHVFAGPAFGVRVRARATSEFEDEEEEDDLSEEVKRLDLGLVVGAGLDFGRLVLDGRYRWGLSNLNDVDDQEGKIKNRTFSIMAGIKF